MSVTHAPDDVLPAAPGELVTVVQIECIPDLRIYWVVPSVLVIRELQTGIRTLGIRVVPNGFERTVGQVNFLAHGRKPRRSYRREHEPVFTLPSNRNVSFDHDGILR